MLASELYSPFDMNLLETFVSSLQFWQQLDSQNGFDAISNLSERMSLIPNGVNLRVLTAIVMVCANYYETRAIYAKCLVSVSFNTVCVTPWVTQLMAV